MSKFRKRCIVLLVLTGAIALVFSYRLFDLQVIHGKEFAEKSEKQYITEIEEPAPRGEIYDRYGRPLVTNRVAYTLKIQKMDYTYAEENEILLKLLSLLRDNGYIWDGGTLPITETAPYSFTFEGDNSAEQEEKWKKKNNMKPEATAQDFVDSYIKKYKISSDYTEEEKRLLVGLRYQMSVEQYSTAAPFEIAKDVDMNIVTKIKENEHVFSNVIVGSDYVREYERPELLSHVIGRIGKIDPTEYETKKDQGYKYNDYIGKQGIEKAMEDSLRGESGTRRIIKNKDGEIVDSVITKEPISGDYTVLTIDIEMQKVLEEALRDTIENIRMEAQTNKDNSGADANAGASVVIDVNTGEVLAMASYPSYNLEDFNKSYSELIQNPDRPMFNRALMGTYEPGSTFKMVTASAALANGVITPKTKILDQGIYTFYKDYQPQCMAWRKNRTTHGNINVGEALKFSCNYFFYEAGRLTGIDEILKYCHLYGLGEPTGIELSFEEAQGTLRKPEEGKVWNPGDTLQISIGQTNLFTPLQLTNYIATLANGGNLYEPHLVKGVRSAEDGRIVSKTESKVRSEVGLSKENLNAITEGMLSVTQEGGTAYSIFRDFPVQVAAKTGTAQVSTGSDTGIFAAFAPYDNPEIAVVTIIEHGTSGGSVAPVTKKVMEYYFSNELGVSDYENTGELLP